MSQSIESTPIETFTEYDVHERYDGYLKLVKMVDVINAVAGDSIATESRQAHGFKKIIYTTSGTHDITRWANIKSYGSGVDLHSMIGSELDTVLQSGVDKGGVYTAVGTFDPVEGEDIIINIHGQHILRSNPDMYAIEMYNANFATLLSKFYVDKSDGNIYASGVVGQKVVLQIGENTKVIVEDGVITLFGTTVNLNLTDLVVSGTLTVQGITTLNSATTVNATLDTTGKASLEGTNIESS